MAGGPPSRRNNMALQLGSASRSKAIPSMGEFPLYRPPSRLAIEHAREMWAESDGMDAVP